MEGRKNQRFPALPPALRRMAEEGRLVHAVNLEGEPGSGRFALAMALAGAILCQEQRGEMCGKCLACQKVLAGVHSDVTVADGKEDPERFKVGPLRELCAGAHRSPNEGRAKVYIIAEAQLLPTASQNVLLKVIEEPPEDTFFILTCDNKFRLLPTVLSRVVTVAMPTLTVEQCREELRRRVAGKTEEEYREAALLGCGNPGAAERILTLAKAAKEARAARALVEAMAGRDPYRTIAAATPFEKERTAYAALLDAAARLCALPELRQELGLTPVAAAGIRQRLDKTAERNRQNGYLPLLTATLAGSPPQARPTTAPAGPYLGAGR